MTTPILDFIKKYQSSDTARLHMPGAKGVQILGPEGLDITEIKGADELYSPDGIIAESEQNATQLFDTGMTVYSTEGSSHCIRSMLLLARQLYMQSDDQIILAARNVHKSFLYGCAVADIDVEWMYANDTDINSVAAGIITPDELKESLRNCLAAGKSVFAVYITSPNYLGGIADIAGIKKVCAEYNLPLLVDNAHGAYLHFLPEKQHPMDLGADICCDSAHKTLPVLTGGAYLHLSKETVNRYKNTELLQLVKSFMEMTGTTSPSYLIMASLDRSTALINDSLKEEYENLADYMDNWKNTLKAEGIPVLDGEPLKVVVDANALGMSGKELADMLREEGGEPEFADNDYLVCMVTPQNSRKDLDILRSSLIKAKKLGLPKKIREKLSLVKLDKKLSIRESVLGKQKIVSVTEAEGEICGLPAGTCPPAVPIAISGEVITRDTIKLFKAVGIEKVAVIR